MGYLLASLVLIIKAALLLQFPLTILFAFPGTAVYTAEVNIINQ